MCPPLLLNCFIYSITNLLYGSNLISISEKLSKFSFIFTLSLESRFINLKGVFQSLENDDQFCVQYPVY